MMATHDRTQRLRLIACVALVMAPHATRIPLWVSLFAGAILLWQVLAAWRGLPRAGRLLRIGLVVLAAAGVYVSFGHINGQHAGVALLVLMLALKLAEAHHARDVTVLLGLCYLTLITQFLFSQSIFMACFLVLAAWLVTACYLDANHPGTALPARTMLRGSAALIMHALPVAVILFVLFPRIPGNLWGLPSDHGAVATTGLSDTMSPGSISHLARSDAVAFRVRFQGPIPPRKQLYWRGPVLWVFDGQSWRHGQPQQPHTTPDRLYRGSAVHYTVTLEPNQLHWLPALDIPATHPTPPTVAFWPVPACTATTSLPSARSIKSPPTATTACSHMHQRTNWPTPCNYRSTATRVRAPWQSAGAVRDSHPSRLSAPRYSISLDSHSCTHCGRLHCPVTTVLMHSCSIPAAVFANITPAHLPF